MKDLVGKGKPFYSALDLGAKALKRKVGTGSEFLKELMALPGVKPTELKERNLEGLMNAPRMTHEEFLTHLAAKPAPAIQEKVLQYPNYDELENKAQEILRQRAYNELLQEGYTENQAKKKLEDRLSELQAEESHVEEARKTARSDMLENKTYHGAYTLPGGKNYREMLIKLPDPRYDMDTKRFELDAQLRRAAPEKRSAIMRQMDELREKYNNTPEVFEGVGSHFGGESGILASMRLKDRTGPNGEKLLHLEELQSDWHQQGRDKGYIDPNAEQKLQQIEKLKSAFEELQTRRRQLHEQAKQEPDAGPRFDSLMEEANSITPKLLELNSQMHNLEHFGRQQKDAVPDAPFKKNWEEMALKRLMHHAAEKGYHGLVVTPGKEQADRYNLAKHVGMVAYHPEEQRFQAFKPNRETVMNERGVTPERISELIGKEAAERLLKAPKVGDHHFLEGEQLQMGGEGMKAFYDKKVPNILNAIGKKHKVKTQLYGHKLPHPEADLPAINEANAIRAQHGHPPVHQATLHHFPITEEMRKDILTNGLPLYKEGGMIHKAIGGTVQPSINQMRMALMQNKFVVPSSDLKTIGAQEAPQLDTKLYINEGGQDGMGGVDMNAMQPGMQLMQAQPNLDPTKNQPQQGGQPPSAGASSPAQQPPSNILQMTRQGQAMNAMTPPQQPAKMKNGGHMKDGGSEKKAAFSPKLLASTASKMASKIAKENPKLTSEEVMKKALRLAEQKLSWEKQTKPETVAKYGELEKSNFSDPLSKRMRNTQEVVEERKRKANEFLNQPTEAWQPPPKEKQAFDRAAIKEALTGFPGIEQTAFPRDMPPRANLSHVHEVYEDPENRDLIKRQIMRGLPLGGETFYGSLYPLKLASLEAGHDPKAFDRFVHSIAPASARNSIMNEMAVGQFLRDMHARGIPLTEENVRAGMEEFKQKYGIGLPLMYKTHGQGVRNVLENDQDLREMSKANIPTNYKIPTYGTQKAGDFGKSVVLDVHEAGGQTQGSRYHPYFNEQGGFGNPEYGAAEQHMMNIANELGIPGGMAQAGRWFGGGELTGLRSPRGDALDLLEKQSAYTLHHTGQKPTPANIRKHVLSMIGTGQGVLLPYYKKEGMQDLRTVKKKGGAVKKTKLTDNLDTMRLALTRNKKAK